MGDGRIGGCGDGAKIEHDEDDDERGEIDVAEACANLRRA
jgi:hypothetical protein